MSEILDSSRFLEQATRKREQAKRCRNILRDIMPDSAAELLTHYAMELEERAELLERLAGDSKGRPGRRRMRASRETCLGSAGQKPSQHV